VLYELITGRHVFEASTALAIMHRHYSEIPAPVNVLRPDTDPRLADLVSRLLAKDPGQRPKDAKEVYDTLVPLIRIPATGALIPMDPTRPFRDWMSSTPQRPMPTMTQHATPPPLFPAAPTPPPAYVDPPTVRVSRLDTPTRRLSEGALITSGFIVFGFDLDDVFLHKGVTSVLTGAGIGVLLIFFGARMRKRRLALPHWWSVTWGRLTRPASAGERIMEKTLLIIGLLSSSVYVTEALLDLVHLRPWTMDVSRTVGLTLSFGLLIPGVILRQHRLGKRYPWYL
jgi:hypothetical protein